MLNKENIRVVQLIDSLEAGGAERMAVNLANTLASKIIFSGLITSRREGTLKEALSSSVQYFFTKKKASLDIYSVLRLKKYLKNNNVQVIHAHGSSYFTAVLVKIIYPSVKIFWHDHNGNRINVKKGNFVLKIASLFFNGIFTVNEDLQNWAILNLKTKNVQFIPNFSIRNDKEVKNTTLKGISGKRIVCLANLRYPKNHLFVLESFKKSFIYKEGWTLHLIGDDKEDEYSEKLKLFIKNSDLDNNVFIYGSCNDVENILNQVEIGVLASIYEGFPVTLLEYGMAKIMVISTDVGYCKNIIQNGITGQLISPNNESSLINAFINIPNQLEKNKFLALKLNSFILEKYSKDEITNRILNYYLSWI